MEQLSIYEFTEMVPTEQAAADYFEQYRWHGKPVCPHCGSFAISRCTKPMPFRCRDCRKHFSVRTGTVLAHSKLPLKKWLFALYFMHTARKGVSSIQLGKMLGITQKSAWFLMHRLREFMGTDAMLSGTVEVDETYVGGSDRNRHANKKYRQGPGSGKTAVFGMRERGGKTIAFPIPDASRETLHGAIGNHVERDSTVFSDDWRSYRGLEGYWHAWVRHSRKEYVVDETHTNGIESVWAVLKRMHKGIYHSMSAKHLHRYVNECCERINSIDLTVRECLSQAIPRIVGHRLTNQGLVHHQA